MEVIIAERVFVGPGHILGLQSAAVGIARLKLLFFRETLFLYVFLYNVPIVVRDPGKFYAHA